MYVGRIVAIGRTVWGRVSALYRVSSRSFPNREARSIGDNVAIMPRAGFEDDIKKNPFIAYNCLAVIDRYALVSNGTHTDSIATQLKDGKAMRDILINVLHTYDYEHDALDTPRIAAIVDNQSGTGYLGSVTKQSLAVKEFSLTAGTAFYIATYEHVTPGESYMDCNFDVDSVDSACQYVLSGGVFSELEKPVTAACALENGASGYEIAVANA